MKQIEERVQRLSSDLRDMLREEETAQALMEDPNLLHELANVVNDIVCRVHLYKLKREKLRGP